MEKLLLMNLVKQYSLIASLNLSINNFPLPISFESTTDSVGRVLCCDIRDGLLEEIKRYIAHEQIEYLVANYSTSESISSCLTLSLYHINAVNVNSPNNMELKEVPAFLVLDVANLLSEEIEKLKK